MNGELAKVIEKSVAVLCRIWFDIGITGEQQIARSGVVTMHVSNLLDEMIGEEQNLQRRLLENIKKFGSEVDQLCVELSIPKFELREGASVVQREKDLRIHADELNKLKYERLSRQKQLIQHDKQLRNTLGLAPCQIAPNSVLTASRLDEMEQDLRNMEAEKNRRLEVFRITKMDIVKLLEDLERGPDNSFERDIICDDEKDFVLSNDNMNEMKHFAQTLSKMRTDNLTVASSLREQVQSLWEELNVDDLVRRSFSAKFFGFRPKTIQAEEFSRLTELRSQTCHESFKAKQNELRDLWDRCMISDDQQQTQAHLMSEGTDVKLIDMEIEKVRKYYESSHTMLDKVYRHKELFKELISLEAKVSNYENLFSRGSNLVQEEKARNRVAKDVSVAEQEALSAVDAWEKKSGQLFLIGGVRYKQYVHQQAQSLSKDKTEERWKKLQEKMKQQQKLSANQEAGQKGFVNQEPGQSAEGQSRPLPSATQLKRRFACITPTKIAAKFRKLEEGVRSAPGPAAAGKTSRVASPARHHLDSCGFVVPREPAVVMTRAKVLNEIQCTPLTGIRVTRANHGALFSPASSSLPSTAPRVKTTSTVPTSFATPLGSATKASSTPFALNIRHDNNNVASRDNNRDSNRIAAQETPRQRVTGRNAPYVTTLMIYPALNNAAGIASSSASGLAHAASDAMDVFSATTVTAGPALAGETGCGENDQTMPAIGAYHEFTRGLAQSGKTNFCSSVVALPPPTSKSIFF